MICHGTLAALRPAPANLTRFYLTASFGGALGGIFVAIVAPAVFTEYLELPLGLLLMIPVLLFNMTGQFFSAAIKDRLIYCSLAIAALAILYTGSSLGEARRNFFGVIKVVVKNPGDPELEQLVLDHGITAHGLQFTAPEKRLLPTSYFSPQSGAGLALLNHKPAQKRRIGFIGLGIGTMVVYGTSDDYFRIYEINPDVVELAQERFTYLRDTPAKFDLILGDGRISLERETPQKFDILLLDAFSGGTPPVHLLTKEAFELYLSHLQPDGVIVVNISNRFFRFEPVVVALGREFNLNLAVINSGGDKSLGVLPASFAIMTRTPETLNAVLKGTRHLSYESLPPGLLWTDQKHDFLNLIQRW
jgi:hypothetical protein